MAEDLASHDRPIVGSVLNYKNLNGRVIGVVADFNTISLHHLVEPTVFYLYNHEFGYMYIRILPSNISAVIRYINQQWGEFYPGIDLDLSFVDDNLQKLYNAEKRMADLFAGFTALSILIICLGLFSLVVFMIERRTKEIGIRKILGASEASIITLLSKDFIKLALGAIFIAAPIAWYFPIRWLEGFAYRVQLNAWIFALAALFVITIAILTVAFQSRKAALANPIKAVKME